MYRVIVFIFCLQNCMALGQNIEKELNSSDYKYIKCIDNYSLIIDSSNKSSPLDQQFVGFKDSSLNCTIFFDRNHQIFLKPFYFRESDVIAYFSILNLKGEPLAHWYIISDLNPITLIVIELSKKDQVKYKIGRERGGKSNFHGFNKRLFSQITMQLTLNDFNTCIDEILKRSKREKKRHNR